MKTRTMILAVPVSFLVLILFGGCSNGKDVPKANEVGFSFGTWTNEKMAIQKDVVTPDGWKQYLHMSDSVPLYEGTAKITRKWKDSEGNTWMKVLSSGKAPGDSKYEIFAVLEKYSKSGKVRESVSLSPNSDEELKNPVYPSKIDPQDPTYLIYNHVEK
jgi:hypothetical protein